MFELFEVVSVDTFLPESDLVPIKKPDGTQSGAFAKVLPLTTMNAILAKGTDDMLAFGLRLLAAGLVKADGAPVATEEEWQARTTLKNRDRVMELIKAVGVANGVLSHDQAEDLGNASSGTPEPGSNSSSASGSDAPAESSGSA